MLLLLLLLLLFSTEGLDTALTTLRLRRGGRKLLFPNQDLNPHPLDLESTALATGVCEGANVGGRVVWMRKGVGEWCGRGKGCGGACWEMPGESACVCVVRGGRRGQTESRGSER